MRYASTSAMADSHRFILYSQTTTHSARFNTCASYKNTAGTRTEDSIKTGEKNGLKKSRSAAEFREGWRTWDVFSLIYVLGIELTLSVQEAWLTWHSPRSVKRGHMWVFPLQKEKMNLYISVWIHWVFAARGCYCQTVKENEGEKKSFKIPIVLFL